MKTKQNTLEEPRWTYRELVNVRRAAGEGLAEGPVWRPAGLPGAVCQGEYRPLLQVPLEGGGEATLAMKGMLLVAVAGEIGAGAPEQPLELLPAEPLLAESAEQLRPGLVRIHLRHHPSVWLSHDVQGHFTYHGEQPPWPAVRLTVRPGAPVTVALGPAALTGLSPAPGALTVEDTRRATAALLEAYGRLQGRVRAAGMWLQPVLVRYRLEDSQGGTLYRAPWHLVASAQGVQCAEGATALADADMKSLSGGALTAVPYQLEVAVAGTLPEPWATLGARLVVETSEELDPVDPQGEGRATATAPGGAGVVNVRLGLPGVDGGRALALRALAAAPSLACEAGVWTLPFASGSLPAGAACGPDAAQGRSGAKRRQRLLSALEKAEKEPIEEAADTSGTTYAAALRHGALTLLADALEEPLWAPSPLALCVGAESGTAPWRGYATVTYDDGTRTVATAAGQGEAPTLMAPGLSVASRRARSLTVAVERGDGQVLTATFALSPLRGADMACCLSEDLRGRALEAAKGAYRVPLATARPRHTPGRVDSFRTGRYGTALATAPTPQGEAVTALAAAVNGEGQWGQARSKVLLFGPGGTALTGLDAQGRFGLWQRLDNRPVREAGAVADASGRDATGARRIMAIAGGDLVAMTAQRVVTALRACPGSSLGWDAAHHELWIAGPEGLWRLGQEGDLSRARYAGLPPGEVELWPWRGELLLVGAGATRSAARDTAEARTPIVVEGEALTGYPYGRRLAAAVLGVAGTDVEATWRLLGDRCTGSPELLTEVTLTGDVNGPVEVALEAPARPVVTQRIAGLMGDDARVWGTRVRYKN